MIYRKMQKQYTLDKIFTTDLITVYVLARVPFKLFCYTIKLMSYADKSRDQCDKIRGNSDIKFAQSCDIFVFTRYTARYLVR